jgi:serine/threonine protein kinase
VPDSNPPDNLAEQLRDPTPLAPVPSHLVEQVLRAVADPDVTSDYARPPHDGTPGIGIEGPVAEIPKAIGPYRVLGELGRGGMGVVLKAEDPGLDRLVAIKVMHPSAAAKTNGVSGSSRKPEQPRRSSTTTS